MSPFISVLGTGPVPLVTAVPTGGTTAPTGSFSMVFDYYMYGQYMGVWLMYWENNGTLSGPLTFTANGVSGLTSLSGQQQTARGQSWRTASVDLSSYAGQSGRVVWLYYRNTNNSYNYQGDIAFDAFRFTNDSGVITNIFPTAGSTDFQGQSIGRIYSSLANSVSDWNNGSITLNTINTTYRYNGPWWFDTFSPPSSGTGPSDNSPNNTASDYHLICETTNFTETNMYYDNRYAFFTTTNTYTDGVPDYVTNNLVFHIDAGDINSYDSENSATTVYNLIHNDSSSSFNSNIGHSTSDGGYWSFDYDTSYGIEFEIGGNNNYLNIGSNDFTIEMWMKPTDLHFSSFSIPLEYVQEVPQSGYEFSDYAQFFVLLNNSSDKGIVRLRTFYGARPNNSAITFTSNAFISTTWQNNSSWVHYVVTSDVGSTSGTRTVYKNGQFLNSLSNSNFIFLRNAADNQLHIGGASTAAIFPYPFLGDISIVRIYNGKALTASEVTQNFNAEKARYGYS